MTTPPHPSLRVEGALLSRDFLSRLSSSNPDIEPLSAVSYGLPANARLGEAITASWNALRGRYEKFRDEESKKIPGDAFTGRTRELWLLPFFDTLGYGRLATRRALEIGEKSYAISHGWGEVLVHLVGAGLELDKRAPGQIGAAAMPPHSLVQEALNKSGAHSWGLVSNGRKLRLLRDNASLSRQAFIEWDLELMFANDLFSDFALLWMLCHPTRLETKAPANVDGEESPSGAPPILEQWVQSAAREGTRARDRLRDGVEKSIAQLGVGFLRAPQNREFRALLESGDLSREEFYRHLLRLVYRLLFCLVAEDKEALLNAGASEEAKARYVQYFSFARLRKIARRAKGTSHCDAWRGAGVVFAALRGDDDAASQAARDGLALPALGGFLFESTPLDALQLSNADFYEAVRALSFIDQDGKRRPVNYRDLGSEELGSVYESLLELHPDLDVPARAFSLTTAAGHERKTTGSYYTPAGLVKSLLDSALDPVIERALRPSPPSPLSRGAGEQIASERISKASREMIVRARALRQSQTQAEEFLWELLRDRQLDGLKFRRQHPIGNFIADFYCREINLIIELDGAIHAEPSQAERDRKREEVLKQHNFQILRLQNREVLDTPEQALQKIQTKKVPLSRGAGEGGWGVRAEQEAALLSLRICDPACGSGHFLVAAANRLARKLAEIRSGGDEPAPEIFALARRDVIAHCIYGIDLNPMAVELCKVALWMESIGTDKPLSFLDAHIRSGNALLGATPEMVENGIPDEAFAVLEGDEKSVIAYWKKENRKQRDGGQGVLIESQDQWNLGVLTREIQKIEAAPDDHIENVRAKERMFAALQKSEAYRFSHLLYDAWCAAFVWIKTKDTSDNHLTSLTTNDIKRLRREPYYLRGARETEVLRLRAQYQWFHPHLEFPDVFAPSPPVPLSQELGEGVARSAGGEGFDLVLGNPPWERVKLQEKEWFASRAPEIANARNAAARKSAIEKLKQSDPDLHRAFLDARRSAEGESHFARASGRFPLCGRGDVNTYALFAELNRNLISQVGRVGCIVPSGIATDDTTKWFFSDLVQKRELVSLFDFENRLGIFPGVHRSFKFCLLTLGAQSDAMQFAFFCHRAEDAEDPNKRFALSPEEIALLNPNTRTCPIFRSSRDAELTKAIYRRVPVLLDEKSAANPWGISFLRMFDMSNDSACFARATRDGQMWRVEYSDGTQAEYSADDFAAQFLPLCEAKMTSHYDHRASQVVISETAMIRQGQPEYSTLAQHQDPNYLPMPRYWVTKDEVHKAIPDEFGKRWFYGFANVSSPTNHRSFVGTIIPAYGVGNSLPIILFPKDLPANLAACFCANLSSFIFDYLVRQKMGGVNLNFYIIKQLPVLPPAEYSAPRGWTQGRSLCDWIAVRVLELTYTARDLAGWAHDLDYSGAPFGWDEARRREIRCELDAAFFHLYGIAREDAEYILHTFPITRRKDEAQFGEFLTARRVLEFYDAMANSE